MLASPYTTTRSSRPPAAAVRSTISGPTPEASPIVMAIGGVALTAPAPATRSTTLDGVPKPPGLVRSKGPSLPHARLHGDAGRDGAADEHGAISEHGSRGVTSDDDDGGEPAGLDRFPSNGAEHRCDRVGVIELCRRRPQHRDACRLGCSCLRERHRMQASTHDERRRVARWSLGRRTGGLQRRVAAAAMTAAVPASTTSECADHAASDRVEVPVGRRVAHRAADADGVSSHSATVEGVTASTAGRAGVAQVVGGSARAHGPPSVGRRGAFGDGHAVHGDDTVDADAPRGRERGHDQQRDGVGLLAGDDLVGPVAAQRRVDLVERVRRRRCRSSRGRRSRGR